jgi:hypothetical protein
MIMSSTHVSAIYGYLLCGATVRTAEERAIVVYGKVVHFLSFQTKHALMCKIHEQDSVSSETFSV